MMPLPTYTFPRHETESRMPAETRRALRWEGISGALPGTPRKPWLARVWGRLVGHGTPEAPARAPARAPAQTPQLLREVAPLLRPEANRLPPPTTIRTRAPSGAMRARGALDLRMPPEPAEPRAPTLPLPEPPAIGPPFEPRGPAGP